MKLNFDDIVGSVLNDEVHKKASDKTSNVALNIEIGEEV